MAILYEPLPSWPARQNIKKDTCVLVVLSVDLNKRQFSLLYRIPQLPMTCNSVFACSRPVPGLLILGADELLHVDQGLVTVNKAVSTAVEGIAVDLQGVKACFLDAEHFIMTTQKGEIVLMEIQREGGRVADFLLKWIGHTVIPSTMIIINEEYWFIGSVMQNSQLVRFEERRKHQARGDILVVLFLSFLSYLKLETRLP